MYDQKGRGFLQISEGPSSLGVFNDSVFRAGALGYSNDSAHIAALKTGQPIAVISLVAAHRKRVTGGTEWQLCLRTGRSCANLYADHFARNDNFDSAILLSSLRSGVVGYVSSFAKSPRGHVPICQPLLKEIGPHGFRALVRQFLVYFVAADVVCVAFDCKVQTRMCQDNAG